LPVTAVTQAALRSRQAARDDGLTFTAFGGKAHEVRAIGDRFDTNYSKIEVLWALANYYIRIDHPTQGQSVREDVISG
jgi:hypothetical protein